MYGEVKIETYRDIDIFFYPHAETFSFHSDSAKEKQSLTACRKAIDEFIKENETFEPFNAVRRDSPERFVKIVAIRKDHDFTVELPDGSRDRLSSYREDEYVVEQEGDAIIFEEIRTLNEKIKEKRTEFEKTVIDPLEEAVKEKYSLLKAIPLAEYKKQLFKQSEERIISKLT